MSNYKDNWYPIVVKVTNNYPDYRDRKNAAQEQNIIASYSGMPHSGRVSRNAENAALRSLAPQEEADLEAVETTISTIMHQRDGREVMKIIELVDFRKTHRLSGAANVLHMSYETAQRRRQRFLHMLAKNLGYKS